VELTAELHAAAFFDRGVLCALTSAGKTTARIAQATALGNRIDIGSIDKTVS
jgi:hypothetical protein